MIDRRASKKRRRRPPQWRLVEVDNSPLFKLVGPLASQKNRKKTIVVAIGTKRLKTVLDALNEMEIEV